MLNARAILGLQANIDKKQIIQAYREKSALHHPDKGGNAEMMKLINQARDELLQQVENSEFIEFSLEELDELLSESINESIDFSSDRLSNKYRQLYNSWLVKFSQEDVRQELAHIHFKKFTTSLYSDIFAKGEEVSTQDYKDLFDFLQQKNTSTECEQLPELNEELTPQNAVTIFIKFIEGECFGNELNKAKIIFTEHLKHISEINPIHKLYIGISEVLHFEKITPGEEIFLLASLSKIISFIRQNLVAAMPYCAILLQNIYFRSLFSQAVHLLWQDSSNGLHQDDLTDFVEPETIKAHLGTLAKQVLSNAKNQQEDLELLKATHYIKKLYEFEQFVTQTPKQPINITFYREHGFAILDWLSVLLPYANRNIIVNMLMHAGVYFQKASTGNFVNEKKADQLLALHSYMEAISVANCSSPDLEIYTISNCLKFISSFNYEDDILPDLINALQNRVLSLINFFPIFIPLQSNISFIYNNQPILLVMRSFLQSLIKIIEHNKTAPQPISMDYEQVEVLYQAYEASIKCWYQEYYDAKLENQFRLELMELLLKNNNWSFKDLNPHLLSHIAMPRDEKGWASFVPPLKIITPKIQSFASLEGVKINYNTGKIVFVVKEFIEGYATSRLNTCNVADLAEMLAKDIIGGSFSLDPVDPDMMYHPFNVMRFAPKDLYQTQFLNTMLLADYILKFLTTGQEVQGKYPYDFREIQQAISHLPLKLKNIINNFHTSQQHKTGAIHRFWIEAQEVTQAEIDKSEEYKTAIADLKMVVKKHTMERDSHGNLVDTEKDDEGWDLYIFTDQERRDFYKGNKQIIGPAMLFSEGHPKVSFVINNKIYKQATISIKHLEQLEILTTHQRDPDGKVKVTINNSTLIYDLTTSLAIRNQEATRFSPEYVFAQEFTANYDEFGKYIPILSRLKELSKISIVVRILHLKKLEAESRCRNLQRLIELISNSEKIDVFKQSEATGEEAEFEIFKQNNAEFIKNILPHNIYQRHIKNVVQASLAKELTKKDLIEIKTNLTIEINQSKQLIKTFAAIGLGKYARKDEDIGLEDECLWVPASVKHHVTNNSLYFVYGGVRVCPRINVINTSNSNFNSTMNNAFANSNRISVNNNAIAKVSAQIQASSSSYRGVGSSSGNNIGGGNPSGGNGDDGSNRYGGGKNAQHANRDARNAAKERLDAAKEEFKRLNQLPPSKELSEQKDNLKKQIRHYQRKVDFTGENHSQRPKGGNR